MSLSSCIYLALCGLLAIISLLLLIGFKATLQAPSKRLAKGEALTLILLLLLGIAIVYGKFITGSQTFSYTDVGSDTSEQYVPYYLSLLDGIRNGTFSFWNFEYGLGSSFMSYQSWTLDPFNIVLIPLGLALGNSALPYILVIVQACKILCCGVLFNLLLTRYAQIPLARMVGSLLFAFCGYLMLWGQHYWLGSVIVVATVLAVLLEALMERWTAPRFVGLMLATSLCIMMSTYSGFMVMLFATAYAVLRVASLPQVKGPLDFFKRFGILAIPVICGLLIACVTLLPYATLLLGESSRVSGSGDVSTSSKAIGYLVGFVPVRWIPAILSRALGSGLISCGLAIPTETIPTSQYFNAVNVYEFIQLGFGTCLFILLGQFFHWLIKDAPRRTKVLAGITTALVVLYCFNFFLPAFSNALVEPKYRSCFAVAFPLCIAAAVALDQRIFRGTVARIPVIACAVLTLATIGWSFLNTVDGRWGCLAYAILTVVATLVLLLCKGGENATAPGHYSQPAFALMLVICACVVGGSWIDGYLVTNHRATVDRENFPQAYQPGKDDSTQQALAWLAEHDTSVYRVEKLYSEWTRLNDSLVQHYWGISSYNSTLDSDIEDFYANLWPEVIMGDTAYQQYLSNPDQPQLLRATGVKYLLATDDLPFTWCWQIASFGNVRVYQVTNTVNLASTYTCAITESQAATLTLDQRRSILNDVLIVSDEANLGTKYSNYLLTQNLDSTVAETHDSTAEATNDSTLTATPDSTITVTDDGTASAKVDGTITVTNDGAVNAIQVTSAGAGTLTGTVQANSACMVLLPLPNTLGWTVEVDGVPVKTFRADYGFMGFEVEPGGHKITARFAPANLSKGALIAGVTLLLSLIGCGFASRIIRRRRAA